MNAIGRLGAPLGPTLLGVTLLGLGLVPAATAQEDAPRLLEVGETAPDFELEGATRFGILETPVRLSDFRGQTVVLAFFFRVRTKG